MTTEEQRIAIAQDRGWTDILIYRDRMVGYPPCATESTGQPVPDYPGDLNAMHNALLSIPVNQWDDFQECLEDVARPMDGPAQAKRKAVFTAEAHQLAEAYIKFRNLA